MSASVPRFMRKTATPVYFRNPRIFPPAKSKLTRVRQPTPVDPVEEELLKKWWRDYHLSIAAFKYSFQEEAVLSKDKNIELAFEEELKKENDKWNQETKLIREKFYLDSFSKNIMDYFTKREAYDNEEQARLDILRDKYFSMEGIGDKIITKENIDERLDAIMREPPINFNYAVDYHGKRADLAIQSLSSSPSDELTE